MLTQGAQAAVRPSFSIYELWCFLAISKQLRAALPDWSWNSFGLRRLLDPVATGEGAILKGVGLKEELIEVRFNPTFSSYFSRNGKIRWSISGERRPDITVSYRPLDGEGQWIALDAKYRVGRKNLSDAFSSVHIYRDALRHEGYGGHCRAAILLSPASSEDTQEWFSKDFFEDYGTGVYELKPGLDNKHLGQWLVNIFSK
jgi:hypothetical protein